MDQLRPQASNWNKDIRKLLKEERKTQQEYDYSSNMIRQQILRKEYSTPSFAQSCFTKDFASKLVYY